MTIEQIKKLDDASLRQYLEMLSNLMLTMYGVPGQVLSQYLTIALEIAKRIMSNKTTEDIKS